MYNMRMIAPENWCIVALRYISLHVRGLAWHRSDPCTVAPQCQWGCYALVLLYLKVDIGLNSLHMYKAQNERRI